MKTKLAIVIVLGLVVGGLSAEGSGAPITRGPNAEELAKVEADFARMSETEGSAKAFETYLADDGISLEAEPGDPVKKPALIPGLRDVDKDGSKLTWRCLGAETASSGDFGYTYGVYELHDKDGKLVVQGKYATVWKKLDGKWKAVLDMGNHP